LFGQFYAFYYSRKLSFPRIRFSSNRKSNLVYCIGCSKYCLFLFHPMRGLASKLPHYHHFSHPTSCQDTLVSSSMASPPPPGGSAKPTSIVQFPN